MKKIMMVLLLITLLTAGCTVESANIKEELLSKDDNGTRNFKNQIISSCIDQGGIPITSAWDGRLKDCIFR